MRIWRWVFVLTVFCSPAAMAAPQVLDFEGDVIEGEKKGADLLLQTDTSQLSMNAVLYLREDFNDFHSIDRKKRPRLGAIPPRKRK